MNYNFNNDVSEIAKRFKKNYIPQNQQSLTPDTYLFEQNLQQNYNYSYPTQNYNNYDLNNNYNQTAGYETPVQNEKNLVDYLNTIQEQQHFLLPEIVTKEKEKEPIIGRVWNTINDFASNIEKALLNGIEGTIDFGASSVIEISNMINHIFNSQPKGLLGSEEHQKWLDKSLKHADFIDNLEKFIETDYTNKIVQSQPYNFHFDPIGTIEGDYTNGKSVWDTLQEQSYISNTGAESLIEGTAQGVGQMLPAVAITVASHGTLAPLAYAYTFSSNYGSTLEETLIKDVSYDNAATYAFASASLETILEKLSGGVEALGKGLIDTALQKSGNAIIAKIANNSLGKFAIKALGEGIEEGLSEFINPFLERITYDPDAPLASREEILQSVIIGASVGAIMQGGNSIITKNTTQSQLSNFKEQVDTIDNLINYQIEAYNNGRFSDAEKLAKMIEKKSNKLINDFENIEGISDALKTSNMINKLLTLDRLSTKKDIQKFQNAIDNLHQSLETELQTLSSKQRKIFISSNNIGYMFNTQGKLKKDYLNLTQEQKNDAFNVSRKLTKLDPNVTVEYVYKNKNNQGHYNRNTNTITINLKSENPYRVVGIHEFIHSLEGTKSYNDLKDFVINNTKTKNTYDSRFNELSKRYDNAFNDFVSKTSLYEDFQTGKIDKNDYKKRYDEEKRKYVEKEMVAEIVSEDIFNNEEVINNLVGENESLGKRILKWIKEKINSKDVEYRQMQKELKTAKKLFEKALAEKKESSEEEIKHSLKEKTFKFPNDYKNKLKQDSFFDNYEFKIVSIDKLVKDNNLDAKDHLSTYHELEWGTDIEKYSIDEEKINDWSFNPPRAVYKDGKYIIEDGKHRIKALQNDGYDNIELLVYNEDVKYSLKEKKTKAPNVKNTKDIPATYVKGKAEYQRQKVYSKREATGIYEELIHNIANESGIAIDKNVEKNVINYIYQQLNTNKATSIQIADKVIDYIMKESGLSKGNLPIEYEQNLIKDFRDFIATEAFYGGKLSFRTKMENKILDLRHKARYNEALFNNSTKIAKKLNTLKELTSRDFQYTANAEVVADMLKKGVVLLKEITPTNFYKPETRKTIFKLKQDWYNSKNNLLDIDGEIENEFHKITYNIDSKENLSIEEIKALNNILGSMVKIIKDYDKVRVNGKVESISNLAKEGIESVESAYTPQQSNSKALNNAKNIFKKSYRKLLVKPSTYFRSVEGSVLGEKGVLTRLLVDEIRKNETKFYENVMNLSEPFENFFAENKKYRKSLAKQMDFKNNKITKAQAISIYMLSLRQQARGHFMSDVDSNAKGLTLYDDEGNFRTKLILTQSDIDALYEGFNAQDLQYIKLVHEFFNKHARALKIDTDIRVLGSTNILEENYYPIITDSIVRYKNLGDPRSQNLDSLFGLYFNEDVVEGANSEVKLMGVDTMVFSHIQKVSRYNAYMEVVKNIRQVLNKRIPTGANNNETISLLETIKRKHPEFEKYLNDWLVDSVTSSKLSSDESKFLAAVRKNYASYVLGFKFSTVINQLTIIPTAINVLSSKSLISAANLKIKGNKDLMDKYCPYVKYRNYSGNIKTSEINVSSSLNIVQDLLLRPMAFMDRKTIQILWKACQIEARDKYGLELNTKENLTKSGELLELTVRTTQAIDISEMPEIQRTNSDLLKTILAFTKQNTQTISTITNCIAEYRTIKNRMKYEGATEANKQKLKQINKNGAKALAGLLTSTLGYTLVAMLFKKILHKDDEEKNDIVEFAGDFVSNVAGMVPIFSMIYGKLFEGYDMKLSSMDMFNDVADAITGIYKTITTGDVKISWYKFVNAFGMATGIPTKNIMEYSNAFISIFDPNLAYKYRSNWYNKSVSEYTNDFEESISNGDSKSAKSILGQIYNEKNIDANNDVISRVYSVLSSRDIDNKSLLIPKTANQKFTYNTVEYEMSNKQYKQFKQKYSSSINSKVKALTSRAGYFGLNKEEQAQAIKYIQDFAYFESLENVMKIDMSDSTKLNLLSKAINPYTIAIVMAKCKGSLKGNKTQIQRYINSLSLSSSQKHLLYGLLGYKPIKENSYVQVSNFLTIVGYSRTKIQYILEKCKLI